MLRTAGSEPVCDALGRLQSRSDDDFVRAVAAQVAADEKVCIAAHLPARSFETFCQNTPSKVFFFKLNLNLTT